MGVNKYDGPFSYATYIPVTLQDEMVEKKWPKYQGGNIFWPIESGDSFLYSS